MDYDTKAGSDMRGKKGHFQVGDLVTFEKGDRWMPPNSDDIGIITKIFDNQMGDLVTVWWGGSRHQNLFALVLQKL